jgi:hypothetical protein
MYTQSSILYNIISTITEFNDFKYVELTDTFRSRSMCSILQKQIKKLTIRDDRMSIGMRNLWKYFLI